ncbi:hypothetical protein GCM10028803_11700 [Larkinella knui]|uniref:Uncharacterized protein n=1 Tax=Larkinella knui TaxID=2025310 RepID=A0A3P1CC26_9BACT|nr:hypothetical protein [Larkinella knui]RRB10867.1 hypothetical protein EHT87_27365 [Larkinella knui]
MKLSLMNGHYHSADALDILTQMTHIKVSYQERQIKTSDNEEDVKFREKRIKELQRNLEEARRYIAQYGQPGLSIKAEIVLIAH